MAAALSGSGAGPGPGAEPPAGLDRAPEEELPPLDPAEVRSRLEHSERQFRNRRKILIRGLPADVTNQDVHELLKDYELKYCFVDKYKGTAFLTLLDAEQASCAVQRLQGRRLRGRELRPQLQSADSVLCVANLPRLLSQQRFEELLRPFGNLERCFLVYSPATGHSKGYGFVEFMKKDSAARARSELLGKQLGTRTLYVHWSEAAALSPELLHSRCLCVDKLPHGYSDLQQLQGLFGAIHKPTFCQLAQGRGFAVLEFESPEAAERVQEATDGSALAGTRVRVSFCAPGLPARSMLAALIAAQSTALSRGRGLLPEPNPLQLLQSLGSHSLQGKQGILGAAPSLPLLPPPGIPLALLQLQLLHGPSQKPGILGDSPLSSLALPAGAPLGGDPKIGAKPKIQGENGAPSVSLLGAPPRPFLRLLRPHPGKGFQVKPGALGTPRETQQDLSSRIFPRFGPSRNKGSSSSSSSSSPPLGPPLPPFFSGSPGFNFSSGLQAGLRQSQLCKSLSMPPSSDSILTLAAPNHQIKSLSMPPSSDSILTLAAPNHQMKSLSMPPSSDSILTLAAPNHQIKPLSGAPKRSLPQLPPPPERSPEGSYVGQHSQGLGGHYAHSYLKRKRIC